MIGLRFTSLYEGKLLCAFRLDSSPRKFFSMSTPALHSNTSSTAVAVSPFDSSLCRTLYCGEVRPDHVGQTHTFNGWVAVRRDLGGLIFVELRDRTGRLQLVADPQKNPEAHARLSEIRSEAVLSVEGVVTQRPADTVNTSLETGSVEMYPQSVTILNRSKVLPFPMEDEATTVDESVRLKYRYLDLRRPEMNRRIQLRHKLAQAMRSYLNEQGFWEIETPMLIRSTPEGARDYIVPSRVHPGEVFALPQSPQLFKQILVMGGTERYYQLARCFRDEDLRADRQPEFTQIDLEMAFVTQKEVMALVEGLAQRLFQEGGISIPLPLKQMSWHTAMMQYGSDKPDLRCDLTFTDLSEVFKTSAFTVFAEAVTKGGKVLALKVPGAASYSRKELDDLQKEAKSYGGKGLAYILYTQEEGPKSPILKFMSEAEQSAIQAQTGAQTGDAVFFVADTDWVKGATLLGRFRLSFAKRHGWLDSNKHEMFWVVDFPMFEKDSDTGRLVALHHPFTSPQPQDIHLLDTDPVAAKSQAYDLVYNGTELGGGSIRVHSPELQAKLFGLMGLSDEEIQEKFGFLVEALSFGAPPHGGLAVGFDRLVAMLAGVESIREVMAFPKNNQAQCLLSQAPSKPDAEQLDDLHLQWHLPEPEAKPET
jgi:aspartyl-tRNA synthetase